MFGKAGMWIVVTAAAALISFGAVQELPEGEGKQLIGERCGLCHGMDLVTNAKLDRDGWKTVIERMVGYGTDMNDKEVEVAIAYLSKSFGAQPQNSADEKTALQYIEGTCASCHDAELIRTTEATKEEWLNIVINMNGKGAGLSETDVELLANYLAQKYPKK